MSVTHSTQHSRQGGGYVHGSRACQERTRSHADEIIDCVEDAFLCGSATVTDLLDAALRCPARPAVFARSARTSLSCSCYGPNRR